MTTDCDTAPEVVPSDLPQTVYPNGEHNNWSSQTNNGYQFPTGDNAYGNHSTYVQPSTSPLPPKLEAESTVQAIPGSDEGSKWKRRCSCLVIALGIALVVACAIVVALGALLGVTIKEKQDSQADMKALYVSLPASGTSTYIATSVSLSGPEIPSATPTSASTPATHDETEDISNGCSAEEDELTNTTHTSECWTNIDTAAGVPAAGNCILKPGLQTNGKLEYTGDTTHTVILKS